MTSPWKQLQTAFVEDHKTMTRGYRDLLAAIEAGEYVSATTLATKLDALAGPHIAFEEQYLYPEVSAIRGSRYASQLYGEHAETLSVLVQLQALPKDRRPTDDELARWTLGLKHGLDHAAACGTLLSHLQTQSEEKQKEFLTALEDLRENGQRWSELKREPRQKEAQSQANH